MWVALKEMKKGAFQNTSSAWRKVGIEYFYAVATFVIMGLIQQHFIFIFHWLPLYSSEFCFKKIKVVVKDGSLCFIFK